MVSSLCALPHIKFLRLVAVFFLLLSNHSMAANNQGIDVNTKKNIQTLNEYYGLVKEKLGLENRSDKPMPVYRKQTINSGENSQFVPNNARFAAPVSGEGNRPSAAYTPAGRDPFAVTPVMLDNESFTLKQDIDFTPLQSDFRIPNMRLKGVIKGAGKNDGLTALLEVEGLGVFVVKEGDAVGLQGVGNGRDVIQIETISRLSLVVRTGTYGGQSDKRFVIR